MFDFLRPRADRACLLAAGNAMKSLLEESLNSGCSVYETSTADIARAINRIVEAQMAVVSLSTSLLNYCLTDAYYDAGKASPLAGMPRLRVNHDDSLAALHIAWSIFEWGKSSLDMRYRYIYVRKLNSPQEDALWQRIERWSEKQCRNTFEYQRPFDIAWVEFIHALAQADITRANDVLDP